MNTREMTTEELLRMRDEEIDFSDIVDGLLLGDYPVCYFAWVCLECIRIAK